MSTISKGKKLPLVKVEKKGEIILEGGSISHHQWSSESLTGKVRVVNHIAGRSSAKELNESMIDTLKAAGLPQDSYQTTTIINLKDAMWGTSALVAAKADAGKKAFPWSSVVLDDSSQVQKAWGLSKESSAIIVLDSEANVLFFKDGGLNASEVDLVMEIIEGELEEACV